MPDNGSKFGVLKFLRIIVFVLAGAWIVLLGVRVASTSAVAQSSAPSNPGAPLTLRDGVANNELWPSVTLLFDAKKTMTVEDALAARTKFELPASSYSTLGVRKEAAWLRAAFAVDAASDGHWVLDIDYPPLNDIDVYLIRDEKVIHRAKLGSLQSFESRPLQSRSHALPLEVQPGASYELMIRVETRGAMILPITIEKKEVFHTTAVREQMLQGILIGIALCLVLYSFGQWVSSREPLFLKYVLVVAGSLWFTLLQLGVGAQYVWTNNFWMEQHVVGLSSLMAVGGTFLFLEESLRDSPVAGRVFPRIMQAGAALCAVLAVIYAFDLYDTSVLAIIITVLGPMPSLICTPRFISRARRGDPVGIYLLLAWTVYMISVIIITGVIRGYMPVNFWTLHSFQFGATFDMLAFMYVLTLRTKAIRQAAVHASMERDIMRALAHTDPLTGLPNRRSLSDALTQSLAGASQERMLAVYLIDVDEFKPVNDTYGHEIGDELLVEIARRLQANVRSGDIVARLGGDEFVVLANGLRSADQAKDLGNQLLALFEAPVKLSKAEVRIGLTIGYSMAPADGLDTATVLRLADSAMYQGKQDGKRRLQRALATV